MPLPSQRMVTLIIVTHNKWTFHIFFKQVLILCCPRRAETHYFTQNYGHPNWLYGHFNNKYFTQQTFITNRLATTRNPASSLKNFPTF